MFTRRRNNSAKPNDNATNGGSEQNAVANLMEKTLDLDRELEKQVSRRSRSLEPRVRSSGLSNVGDGKGLKSVQFKDVASNHVDERGRATEEISSSNSDVPPPSRRSRSTFSRMQHHRNNSVSRTAEDRKSSSPSSRRCQGDSRTKPGLNSCFFQSSGTETAVVAK